MHRAAVGHATWQATRALEARHHTSSAPSCRPRASSAFAHARTAAGVLEGLDGRIAAVLDGGETTVHTPSTVLDLTVEPARLLRTGVIGREELSPYLELAQ